MKNFLFVTGTRADYGKLKPIADALCAAGFSVSFFVTGMHMLEKYGYTKEEVRKESKFLALEFINHRDGDLLPHILTKTISAFTDYLLELNPDLVVIHGDRVEALACALSCSMLKIRVSHIEGGEVSGTLDEIMRHCISKLSTTHFVSSEDAARRLGRLGEEVERIYVIGSPELDMHVRGSGVDINEVRTRYEISSSDYGVFCYHPTFYDSDHLARRVDDFFYALEQSQQFFVGIMPNNDEGHQLIEKRIEQLPGNRFKVLKSMRFSYFSTLLKNSKLFIGNSSAVVREAPAIGIPSINVGSRQRNRVLSDSVTSISEADLAASPDLINRSWGGEVEPNMAYGSGSAAEKFVSTVVSSDFWDIPLEKIFRDS